MNWKNDFKKNICDQNQFNVYIIVPKNKRNKIEQCQGFCLGLKKLRRNESSKAEALAQLNLN